MVSSSFWWIILFGKLQFCSRYQNLDTPNIPKSADTFDLSRPSKSSVSVTTDFISFIYFALERFLLSESSSFNTYLFRSLRWTSDCPKMSKIVFNRKSFCFPNPDFPITTDLKSSIKISIQKLPSSVWLFDKEIIEFVLPVESWRIRNARNWFNFDIPRYSNL